MDDGISFGRNLSARRHLLDLTQDELARRVGCSVITIRKLEADERRPSKQIAERLAASLSIPDVERAAFLTLARSEPPADAATPPLPTVTPAPSFRSTFPTPLTELIGRDQDLTGVRNQLLRDGVRLLTLVGAPGIGKTSLALAVARLVEASFADGAVFVPLAPISDPELVFSTIAQTLGVKESGDQPVLATLQAQLADQTRLLILDNFEQVLAAAPGTSELLTACPRLKVLATSRAALRVRGEQLYPVPPLLLPDLEQLPPMSALAEFPAVRLFVERAQAVQSAFELVDANAKATAEICTRLDGLPLAIELVAARVRLLPPAALLARLDNRLALLRDGPRDLPPRHQTLRGAIAWSYDLLNPEQQMLYRRLGVFVGGWTLEAAEAVCNADGDLRITVLDGLAALLDQSLLQQTARPNDEPRFTMLETIREYALERLQIEREDEIAYQLHADYFCVFAETADEQISGAHQFTWLARLEHEHDNLRAALEYALHRGDAQLGERLAGALGEFWFRRGFLSEGQRWLARAIDQNSAVSPLRAKTLHRSGVLAEALGDRVEASSLFEKSLSISSSVGDTRGMALALDGLAGAANGPRGDFARVGALYEQSLELFRELGDAWGQQRALRGLGDIAWIFGDYTRARVLFEESLALARGMGDSIGIANSIEDLGKIARSQRDYPRARALLEESWAVYQSLGDTHRLTWALLWLGHVARAEKDDARAAEYYDECLTLAQTLGAQSMIAMVFHNQGYLALHKHDVVRAEALLRESLTISRDLHLNDQIAWALAGLAGLAAAKAQPEHALRILGAAEAWFALVGHVIDAAERDEHDQYVVAARAQLDEATFTAAWAAGHAMTLEQAIADALEGISH